MDIVFLIGLVGGIASIITLFIPDNWKSKKIAFSITLMILIILCGTITHYYQLNDQKRLITTSAATLLKSRDSYPDQLTDEGFMHASLAFLEQNKDLYPDSYKRAQQVAYKINLVGDNPDAQMVYSPEKEHAVNSMEGILKGIAILNEVRK